VDGELIEQEVKVCYERDKSFALIWPQSLGIEETGDHSRSANLRGRQCSKERKGCVRSLNLYHR
jgi:hypothetical protein